MEDYLAIINRVIEEHQAIRENVKLVGDSIPDREALASLEKTRADWIPGRLENFTEKQSKLVQAIASLDEGLRNHFNFEGKALPQLIGDLFMQAIYLDHQEILTEISEGKAVSSETGLEGLNRDELLAKETDIQQKISNICRLVEEHATREEAILEMLRRALEDKEGKQ
jgi:hemerythrin